MLLKIYELREKRHREERTFVVGLNEIMFTPKLYGILKVKNVFGGVSGFFH